MLPILQCTCRAYLLQPLDLIKRLSIAPPPYPNIAPLPTTLASGTLPTLARRPSPCRCVAPSPPLGFACLSTAVESQVFITKLP